MKTTSTFTSVMSLWNEQQRMIPLDKSNDRVHNSAKCAHPAYACERFQRPSATVTQTVARGGKEVVS